MHFTVYLSGITAPAIFEYKTFDMFIIVSIKMLRQRNKKCCKVEVFRLVKDFLDEDIATKTFEELLESFIQSQSIKRNVVKKSRMLVAA